MGDMGAKSDTGVEAVSYKGYDIPLEWGGANELLGTAKKGEKLWIDARRPGYDEDVRWLQFLDESQGGNYRGLRDVRSR